MNMKTVLCIAMLLPNAANAAKDLAVLGAGAGSLLHKSLLAAAGRQYQVRRKALAAAVKPRPIKWEGAR